MTNIFRVLLDSSHPLANLIGKGNPDLPSVWSNHWPKIVALSLCFNHLVLLTIQQCMSAKPIANIHHTRTKVYVNLMNNNLYIWTCQFDSFGLKLHIALCNLCQLFTHPTHIKIAYVPSKLCSVKKETILLSQSFYENFIISGLICQNEFWGIRKPAVIFSKWSIFKKNLVMIHIFR